MRIGPLLLLERMKRRDGDTFAFLLLSLHYRDAQTARMELTWQRCPRPLLWTFRIGGQRTASDGAGRCVGMWLRLPLVGHFRFMLAPRLSLNSPRSVKA